MVEKWLKRYEEGLGVESKKASRIKGIYDSFHLGSMSSKDPPCGKCRITSPDKVGRLDLKRARNGCQQAVVMSFTMTSHSNRRETCWKRTQLQ